MKKIKIVGLILIALVIGGCKEDDIKVLKSFNNGVAISCSDNWSWSVIDNKNFKYAPNLEVFYSNDPGHRYYLSNCHD